MPVRLIDKTAQKLAENAQFWENFTERARSRKYCPSTEEDPKFQNPKAAPQPDAILANKIAGITVKWNPM